MKQQKDQKTMVICLALKKEILCLKVGIFLLTYGHTPEKLLN